MRVYDVNGLKSGDVARRADVNVETVRFYERQGLLPAPPRAPSGYRQYDEEHVQRIRFIKRAQSLGFTLREIADLLALKVEPGGKSRDVKSARRSEDRRDRRQNPRPHPHQGDAGGAPRRLRRRSARPRLPDPARLRRRRGKGRRGDGREEEEYRSRRVEGTRKLRDYHGDDHENARG